MDKESSSLSPIKNHNTKYKSFEEIIFSQRLKGEKQIVYIRFGLLGLLFILVFYITFNQSVPSTFFDIVVSRVSQYVAIVIGLITNIVVFIRLRREKYTIKTSIVLVTLDFLLLSIVHFIMTIETASFTQASVTITIYSLFIILSGRRYSFRLSLYAGIFASVCYLVVTLTNGMDIIRMFGNETPIFTGIGNSGEKEIIYFDIDDVVMRAIIYMIIGLVTGLLARDNKKLILRQSKLFEQNLSLEKTFRENLTRTIDTNIITSKVLKNSVDKVTTNFEDMLNSLNEISVNADEQAELSNYSSKSINNIVESFNKIETDIKEQSEQINSATEKINELIKNINQIKNSSINAKEMSTKLISITYDGSNAVNESIKAIREIEQSSTEIKKINDIINDLADQTNILAMNANIEAANAGVVGKGFGVVANEIRVLASNSSQSANRINVVVDDMLEKIKRGVALSENVVGILANIISGIEQSNQMISVISDSATQQTSSADIIEKNMNSVVEKTKNIIDSINTERSMAGEVQQKAMRVKQLALDTTKDVNKEVNSGKDVKSEMNKMSEISVEIKELSDTLREKLQSYVQIELD